MPFTRLEYQKVWTNSTDFPTYEGSETQVRADMQYHPDAVKEFINGTLLAELEGEDGAALIGCGGSGSLAEALDGVQEVLDAHTEDLKNLAAGESPEAVRAARVEFTADGWTPLEETGRYELRVLQSRHKRLNDAFGYLLRDLVGGAYRTNSWQTAGTDVVYEEATGDIVLTAGNAYDGVIVFFGV